MKFAIGTYVVGRNLRGEFLAWVVGMQRNRVRGLRWMATRRRWGTYTVLVPKARLAGVEDLQKYGPVHPTRSPEVDHPIVREMRRQVELPIDVAAEKPIAVSLPDHTVETGARYVPAPPLPGETRTTYGRGFILTTSVDHVGGETVPVMAETLAEFIGNRGRSRR